MQITKCCDRSVSSRAVGAIRYRVLGGLIAYLLGSRKLGRKNMNTATPWQLQMFKKTLKKKMRFKVLRKYLGTIEVQEKCLLVTCGDNNGAMNYFLRELGGEWTFADLEDVCITEMRELLDQEVLLGTADKLVYPDNYFDRVVTIDVHEHLDDPGPFSHEISRVTKLGGQVICTVPNGDETKIVVKLKDAVGMTKDEYGHARIGLTVGELEEIMRTSSVLPCRSSTFSRFFTEMLELTINFLYVKVLAKRGKVEVEKGQIAPATEGQLRSIKKTFQIYSLIYPIYWLISQLDALVFYTDGYVVVVDGKKSAP
jgi:SAM-dependent methyltransferase